MPEYWFDVQVIIESFSYKWLNEILRIATMFNGDFYIINKFNDVGYAPFELWIVKKRKEHEMKWNLCVRQKVHTAF